MNEQKLKAQMILKGKSVDELCAALKISRSAWFRKIAGTSEFTQSEICELRKQLDLDDCQTIDIFFEEKVT